MTRKRYVKLLVASCEKLWAKQGKHLDGKGLKWYRDLTIAKMDNKSYAEAWESLKEFRELVGM